MKIIIDIDNNQLKKLMNKRVRIKKPIIQDKESAIMHYLTVQSDKIYLNMIKKYNL